MFLDWGNWTDDGACSATCGPGTLRQSRICVNAPGCKGQKKRTIKCNQGKCSEPGKKQKHISKPTCLVQLFIREASSSCCNFRRIHPII